MKAFFLIAFLWPAVALAQTANPNPAPGSVWTNNGPTLGAGWSDGPPTFGGMNPAASNAELPEARRNLDTGLINVKDFGAVGDGIRVPCLVTSTASNTSVTIAPGSVNCAFTAADIGKKIVILEAGSTATTALATTINGVTDATHLTLAAAPGQNLTASSKYVTWGTDNAAAINAAYLQAATQADQSGQQGYVYFPPLPKPQINTPQIRCWGTASQINSAPGSYQVDTAGAGREASQVCALAPMAILLNGSANFSRGAGFKDIGFDGNTLATDVVKSVCLPHGRLTNVMVANPAATGRGLNIGSASGCNTTMTFGLYALVDATFYPSPTTYPDNIVYIDNSDTQHYGLIAVGPATTASIMLTANAANTVLFAPHLWGQAGTYGIRSTAPHVQLYFPQVDWGPGPQVAVSLGGGSAGLPQMVNGGHVLSPDATVVGVQIDSGTRPVIVSGFYCGNFSSTANCIKEVSPNGENLIYGNPSATQAPQYAQTLGQFPTGPGSTAAFSFLGLNLSITPQSSGILTAAATGAMSNNTVNDGGVFKVVVGTGTVPTNGQACSTGGGSTIYTQGTALNVMSATVGQIVPFAVSTRSLAQRGTSYWVDLCGQIKTGGAVSMWNVDLTVKEDGLRQ